MASIPNGAVWDKVIIDASIEDCFAVICDYESYPSFIESFKKCSVLKRSPDGNCVECYYELQLIKTLQYKLQLTKSSQELRWHLISKNDWPFKKNSGGWILNPIEGGKVEAIYYSDVEFSIWIPKHVKNWIIRYVLPQMLNAFKREIEKRKQNK